PWKTPPCRCWSRPSAARWPACYSASSQVPADAALPCGRTRGRTATGLGCADRVGAAVALEVRDVVEGKQPEAAAARDELADARVAILQVQLDRRGRRGPEDVGHRAADRAARTDHEDAIVALGIAG